MSVPTVLDPMGALGRPLLVILLLVATSCDPSAGVGPDPSGTAPDPIFQLPRDLTPAELQVIESSNEFGFDLLREVAEGNRAATVFLSPFSASMALGMTLNGADGATFDAMRETLRFGDLEEEEINSSYAGLLELLGDLDPEVETTVANAIWHRQGTTLREDFRDRVEETFGARIEDLDFSAPDAADIINDWVSGATGGRIDKMVTPPIPGNVVAYLMNAIYFKAGWTVPFDPELTSSAPFRLKDGSTENVEMMMRDDTIPYFGTDRYDAVDLPYGGQAYSMTVVVPREGVDVHDLVEELDAEGWGALTAGFTTIRIQLSLPRFEIEWEGALNDALVAMGMGPAFGPGANFSRMFEGTGAWIDEVKQKSFVRVDEEGTEAAAVTSVVMVESAPPQVRADRPFLFVIRERLSDTILFMGLIVEAPRL
ncbi:MAG: serpin family protein [Gemmatimonadota bacterium]